MALLDGIVGGAQTGMAFNQQRITNKLSRDRLTEQKRQYDSSLDENTRQFNLNHVLNVDANDRNNTESNQKSDDRNRAEVTRKNDTYYETLDVAGYISDDRMSLNFSQINQDIAKGRDSDRFGAAEQLVLGFATQHGSLPEGSEATSVEALDGGGYAITVTNADGSKGVVTEDGTSGPESSVVRFQPGQLGRLANTQFQREVLTNTSKFDPTVMRTGLGLIKADANVQGVNDQRSDFLAEMQHQKQVVDTAKQTGDVGLVRGVESAIAEGGNETAQAIGDDLGVPKPKTTVKSETTVEPNVTQIAENNSTAAPAPVMPFDMKSVTPDTKAGRLILSIEGNGATNPRAATPQEWLQKQQGSKLAKYRDDLANRITTSEKNRAKSTNFKSPPPEKDGILKDKAELAMIDGYLEKDKPTLFAEEPATVDVAKQAAGKTTEQIAEGVDDGTIKVDQATIQAVAAKLQGEGFKEIRDLKRLTAKDAAVARAAIIASSPDATIRARMLQEMVNIFDNVDNSPSVNRKDELAVQDSSRNRALRQRTHLMDMTTLRRSWNDAANKQASAVLNGALDVFFGEDRDEENLDEDAAKQFLRGKPFAEFNLWIKQSDRTEVEIYNAMPGMQGVLSLTVAAMAGEESGGLRESIIDFISRDEVEDAVDPADFDASRLRVDDTGVDAKGRSKATKLYYTDEDGSILDEDGGLQALKNLQPEMYRNALSIGIYNTLNAIKE